MLSTYRSIYYASDKDIYDLMKSKRKRITVDVLLEILRERGIFLSQEDLRDEIIDYVSLLPNDYYSMQLLLEQTQSPARKEKLTAATIDQSVTVEELRRAINTVQGNRSEPCGETYTSSVQGANQFDLGIGYTEIDYSKTTLTQKRPREAKIEFEIGDSATTIRSPANEKASEIVEAVISELRRNRDDDLPTRKIDLSSLTTAGERTTFFTELITNLPRFQLVDVTKVHVDRRIIHENVAEDLSLDEESAGTLPSEDDEMLGVVKRALLHGAGLLQSPEYQSLRERGFYICDIVWLSQQVTLPGHQIEFSAALDNPEGGSGFKYSVRGLFRRKDNGELTKTPRPVDENYRRNLHKSIEEAAWGAIGTVTSSDDRHNSEGDT